MVSSDFGSDGSASVEGMPAQRLTSWRTTSSSCLISFCVASFISQEVSKFLSGLFEITAEAKSAILSLTMLRSISWNGFPLISSKPIWVAILKAITRDIPLSVIIVIILLFVC